MSPFVLEGLDLGDLSCPLATSLEVYVDTEHPLHGLEVHLHSYRLGAEVTGFLTVQMPARVRNQDFLLVRNQDFPLTVEPGTGEGGSYR